MSQSAGAPSGRDPFHDHRELGAVRFAGGEKAKHLIPILGGDRLLALQRPRSAATLRA